MTSLDQETIRRHQAEQRMAAQKSGSSKGWLIGIGAIVVIIALMLASGGSETAPGAAAPDAPLAAPEAAPVTPTE